MGGICDDCKDAEITKETMLGVIAYLEYCKEKDGDDEHEIWRKLPVYERERWVAIGKAIEKFVINFMG